MNPQPVRTRSERYVERIGRPLLDAGTRVSVQRDGGPLGGVVQPYEPEYSHGTFPVRFDDGIWRKMTINDVTVVAPPAPVTHRKGRSR